MGDHRESDALAHTSRVARTRGAANQKAAAVTQRIVDSLHHAGAPLKFVADAVLPIRKESLIGSIAIGVDQALAIGGRQLVIELFQPMPLPIPDHIAQNLTRITRYRGPQPKVLAFADA